MKAGLAKQDTGANSTGATVLVALEGQSLVRQSAERYGFKEEVAYAGLPEAAQKVSCRKVKTDLQADRIAHSTWQLIIQQYIPDR